MIVYCCRSKPGNRSDGATLPMIMVLVMAISWVMVQEAGAEAAPRDPSDQWWTGPLIAPNAGLSKAGMWSFEPYSVVTLHTGNYDNRGHWSRDRNPTNSGSQAYLLAYAITDRLTVQTLPSWAYSWKNDSTSHGVQVGDLPLDFKYRFVDKVPGTIVPDINISFGVGFPTGEFSNLRTPLNGIGSGTWYLRQSVVLQWLTSALDGHPFRVRLYGQVQEPLNKPQVQNISSYGTEYGFSGRVDPGYRMGAGLSFEYAITRNWVLALDIYNSYSTAGHLRGIDRAGHLMSSAFNRSTSWGLAPALEYNFNENVGIVFGVDFSFAGRNTKSYVAPQVAINFSY